MINLLILVCYTLLFSYVTFNLWSYYRKNNVLNGYIFFHVSFLVYYIIIPIIYYIYVEINTGPFNGFVEMIKSSDGNPLYPLAYTTIFYFIFFGFYNFVFINSNNEKRVNELTNNVNTIGIVNRKKYYFAVSAGVFTLLIGLFAEIVIANSLGGFSNAIKMGDQLRAFNGDASFFIPQNRLFFIVLMVSVLAAPYFFAYALSIYNNFIIKCLFMISFAGSLFYLFFNAGRLGLILFISTFFLSFTLKRLKNPIFYTFVFSVIILIMIDLLDQLFFYLSYGYVKETSVSSVNKLINEFAFPYLNLLNINEINNIYGMRWGVDFISWMINVVPTSILQLFSLNKITPGYHFITEFHFGSNPIGGIPTDILTLGMRQFGLIGIVVVGMILAFVCKKIDSIIYRFSNQNFQVLILRVGMIMFVIVPYADLDSFVRNRYDMLFILMFMFAVTVHHFWILKKIDKEV